MTADDTRGQRAAEQRTEQHLEQRIRTLERQWELSQTASGGRFWSDWRLWGVAFVAIAVAEWIELFLI